MAGGNLTLHGWSLSLDSFWGVDAPFYAVATALAGVRPALLHVVPAVIAGLVVVLGVALARDGRPGLSGLAGGATVLALLGLPARPLAYFLLQGPLHVGTALECLVAFAVLARARPGRWRFVAVAVLAAGLVGDLQTLALGVTPVLLAGGVAMARRRDWRAGAPAVAAAPAAVVLAGVLREGAKLFGTFSIAHANPTGSIGTKIANLGRIVRDAPTVFGVNQGVFGAPGMPPALEAVHLVGLLLVAAAAVLAVAALVRGALAGTAPTLAGSAPDAWRLDDLLALALLADLATFALLTVDGTPSYLRYLTAGVIFGAVLAGRLVARATARSRVLALPGLVVLLAYAAAFAVTLTQPAPPQPLVPVARFLADHRLTRGIGDYWSSSIVTVETRGAVAVRPVIAGPNGRLVRYLKQSTRSWYTGKSFEFLVYDASAPFGGVDASTAAATFGPPAQRFVVDGYAVLVYAHPVSVSPVGVY
ncbi:MAG: hypothetical protein ACYDB7_04050 [Mycobacteriales bacterium]